MKLVFAVINQEDKAAVVQNLIDGGFESTWLSTAGGFLGSRNVTMMTGVEEARLDELIEIIRVNCHSREQIISSSASWQEREGGVGLPVKIKVGGATVFVADAEQFWKL